MGISSNCFMSSITAPSQPGSPVPLRQDASIMALVGLAHASSHFSHLLLPLMFPVFIKEFGWSYSELGFMSTVFFIVSGTGQASAGFAVDRFGARPILMLSLATFALACLVASTANSYPAMLVVAALAGAGNCAFHPVDFTILNQRISSPRIGYAFSVHGLTGNLGWAAAPAFLGVISAWANWRAAYAGAALLYAAIFVLLWLNRSQLSTTVVARQAHSSAAGDVGFMRLPVVWWCFSFFLLSTVTLAVVQNFSLPILKAMHQVTLEAATLTLTSYMLCGALGMLVGGFVAAQHAAHSDWWWLRA